MDAGSLQPRGARLAGSFKTTVSNSQERLWTARSLEYSYWGHLASEQWLQCETCEPPLEGNRTGLALMHTTRKEMLSSRSPDSRDDEMKRVFPLSTTYEVAQLARCNVSSMGSAAVTSNSSRRHDPGPRRTAGHEICRELFEKGELSEAVDALDLLVQTGSGVSTFLFYTVLKRCSARKNLVLGQLVHALVIRSGYESNTFLANHILRMYASHGRLKEATYVFTSVATPDAFMWSSIISAHAEHGEGKQAVQLYHQMRSTTVKPDCHVFVAALKACASVADLESGRQVHADVLGSGLLPNVFLGSCMVDMYAKCGMLKDARFVFDGLPTKNVVTWTAMVAGYAEHGFSQQALALYAKMEEEDEILANGVTFACLLKACASAGALQQGKQLHLQIQKRGLMTDTVVGNCVVDMYAKCGSLEDALKVFDDLPTKDVVTWNSMINAYKEHGLGREAVALYALMEREGPNLANNFTFACLLKACGSVGALQQGKQLHATILERGFINDVVVGNCLVDMYAKCGSMEDARMAFDTLPTRNVVTWTALITGYAEKGLGHEALSLYARMHQDSFVPADNVTFASLLKACASIGALQQGKQLHLQILQTGLKSDIVVDNCLVDMYAKCGSLADARRVFDNLPSRDIITWNSLMSGYTDQGQGQEALALYALMEQEGIVLSDTVTFGCLLNACASIGAIQQGKHLHSQILERGLEDDVYVGNCLVDMYVKCGSLEDARRVFDCLPTRDVVTWTSMIAGYAEQALGQEALAVYARMKDEGIVEADEFTFACLLKACTSVGAVQQGRQLHAQIRERGLEADLVVGTCLVDMYAKCGSLEDAWRVFDVLPEKNVVTWTAMLNGLGHNNEGPKALHCFRQMLDNGVQPDETTFICLLVACSHEGLVREGWQYFTAMVEDHRIMPTVHHYVCMVDLLGRSGHLDDAEKMLLAMPFESDVVGWTSLLNSCRCHGDIDRGSRCFEILIRLDPQNASPYVLMANMYADADRWTDVETVENLRKSVGASKKPAKAGIEVSRQVHTFVVGEERDDLSSKLRSVNEQLQEGGHVPHTQLVLKPVSVKDKEDELCGHAEKLALAYGLLNTPHGTPLLVTKNLRMCGDCHGATQIMSRIEKRDIIVRDSHRVHRFVEGSCSCGDRP